MDESFWVMIIIIVVLLAMLYRLHSSKTDIFSISKNFLQKLITHEEVIILNIAQISHLSDIQQIQISGLLSSSYGKRYELSQFIIDFPFVEVALMFHKKVIIGMLVLGNLTNYPAILNRVNKKTQNSVDGCILISSVVINEKFRGRGNATEMLKSVLKKRKTRDFILEVNKNNEIAIKLYRKCEFVNIGYNSDTIIMRKFAH